MRFHLGAAAVEIAERKAQYSEPPLISTLGDWLKKMGDSVFSEEGEFRCWSSAREDGSTWEASVLFERKADWAGDPCMIPGVRHILKHRFDTCDDAIQAALQVAHDKARAGTTGLEESR